MSRVHEWNKGVKLILWANNYCPTSFVGQKSSKNDLNDLNVYFL